MKTYWQHCRKDLVMNCGPYGVCDKNGKDFIMPKNHFGNVQVEGFKKVQFYFQRGIGLLFIAHASRLKKRGIGPKNTELKQPEFIGGRVICKTSLLNSEID